MSASPDPRTAALDRVRAELAALPATPMPPDVVARTRRVVAEAAGRPPRALRRRAAVVAGALVAAAAVVVALVAGVPRPAPQPVAQAGDLGAAGAVAFGRDGAGALADPARLRACLAAAGVPGPDGPLLGGLPYAVDGTPGTLLVLPTGVRGRFRVVVVDDGCGPAGGRVLAQTVAGR